MLILLGRKINVGLYATSTAFLETDTYAKMYMHCHVYALHRPQTQRLCPPVPIYMVISAMVICMSAAALFFCFQCYQAFPELELLQIAYVNIIGKR